MQVHKFQERLKALRHIDEVRYVAFPKLPFIEINDLHFLLGQKESDAH